MSSLVLDPSERRGALSPRSLLMVLSISSSSIIRVFSSLVTSLRGPDTPGINLSYDAVATLSALDATTARGGLLT